MTRETLILTTMVTASTAAVTAAGLPVFAGASYNTWDATGYNNAELESTSAISNIGYAIGDADYHSANQPNAGRRALRWTPNGWTSLSGSPANSAGYKQGHVAAINANSVSVGDNETYNAGGASLGYRALRWASNGGTTQLADLGVSPTGQANTRALALNSAGTTVGFSSKHNGADFRGNRAVVWAANQQAYFELGSLAGQFGTGYLDSKAVDINDSGMIVGTSDCYSSGTYVGQRAVRWTPAGLITQLGVLGTTATGYTYVEGVGINNAGVVAGLASKYGPENAFLGKRAVRYASNSITAVELGGLGGTTIAGVSGAEVRSISDSGLIVGASNKYLLGAEIGTRAVYWSTTGSAAANELPGLGSNAGITHALANAANADGVIVGWAEKYVNNISQGNRAVIWTTVGTDTVFELNALVDDERWNLTEAASISDTGFVSGVGVYDSDVGGGTPGYKRHFSMLIPQAGTYGRGDANFDTKIDFDDLLILAQHYGQANPGQEHDVGDLDLDGEVDFDDLLTLAQHYGQASAIGDETNFHSDFAADWAMAQTLVPEPLMLMALPIIALFKRERR